ncbi:MAG: NAD(P)/FAD-dependent oxidoreductase [Candidatus Thiodiazotropha taylori]|nr:NAD(P)/FAD-dependent oxidoreductase [Candidatus Thiodiazotropha taylori]
MRQRTTDVCVVGAGPAGSAIAQQLAELGHQVLVIEKQMYPRSHVGICLSDTTNSLLERIGASSSLNGENSLRRNRTLIKWGTQAASSAAQPGTNVDRGHFDQVLLQCAAKSGANILQPGHVHAIQAVQGGGWHIQVSTQNHDEQVHAQFMVDASGRSNSLFKKLIRYAPPLFALHSTWTLLEPPPYDGFIEAGKNEWLWIASLNNKQAMVTVYTDPKCVSIHGHPTDFYKSMLSRFSFSHLLKLDRMVTEVEGCDASSRYALETIGQNFICVGDARLRVDPMASQGVHLALTSGIQAAAVVNTLLRDSSNHEAALEFYKDRQMEQVEMFRVQTASEYAKAAIGFQTKFWSERAIGALSPINSAAKPQPPLASDQEISICPKVRFLPTPILKEHFIVIEPALYHPTLKRPVAFLGGQKIVPLLTAASGTFTPHQLLRIWQNQLSQFLAKQIIEWLWEKKILVPTAH